MQRDFYFTLATPLQWYNVWTLITQDSTFVDATFTNAPYVPTMVQEFQWQNQTSGATVQESDNKKEAGLQGSSGGGNLRRSSVNSINLKNLYFMTDTASTQLYVSITAN